MFGDNLKRMREAKGLSQQGLADLAGLSRDGVAKLEAGQRIPSWDTVRALAKALGVPVSEFEVGEEEAPTLGLPPAYP